MTEIEILKLEKKQLIEKIERLEIEKRHLQSTLDIIGRLVNVGNKSHEVYQHLCSGQKVLTCVHQFKAVDTNHNLGNGNECVECIKCGFRP